MRECAAWVGGRGGAGYGWGRVGWGAGEGDEEEGDGGGVEADGQGAEGEGLSDEREEQAGYGEQGGHTRLSRRGLGALGAGRGEAQLAGEVVDELAGGAAGAALVARGPGERTAAQVVGGDG